MIAPAAKAVGPRGERSFRRISHARSSRQSASTDARQSDDVSRACEARIERGKLQLHGAYFGVATGDLSVRDPATQRFERVAADEHAQAFAAPRF